MYNNLRCLLLCMSLASNQQCPVLLWLWLQSEIVPEIHCWWCLPLLPHCSLGGEVWGREERIGTSSENGLLGYSWANKFKALLPISSMSTSTMKVFFAQSHSQNYTIRCCQIDQNLGPWLPSLTLSLSERKPSWYTSVIMFMFLHVFCTPCSTKFLT